MSLATLLSSFVVLPSSPDMMMIRIGINLIFFYFIFHSLFRSEFDVNGRDEKGYTLLLTAVSCGFKEDMELILKTPNVNVNATLPDGVSGSL
jgi:ankyrin repeat protein